MRNNLFLVWIATAILYVLPQDAKADDIDSDPDLVNMSLQEIIQKYAVTSVSKRSENASQVAAALYVITQEDIRRSGLQSIPELLRMVPGLQVAESGSQNWAVTSRGFNSQFAAKMLVMIDGRTVYTPVYSGVFWDVQNVVLEDIDRIEVIRGPGASVWGSNAVNGVINIITKNAKDTQGKMVTVEAGTQERDAEVMQYGGRSGDLYYRAYGQYFDYNQQHFANGNGAGDAWDNGQGGFRMDWDGSAKDTGTLQGDAYQGQEGATRDFPVTSSVSPSLINVLNTTDDVSGMNILGRWKHEFDSDSSITLQSYYDDAVREYDLEGVFPGVAYHTQTLDFDFQHDWTFNRYNDITWGVGYRRINSDFGNDLFVTYTPENYYDNLFSSFFQDKISLVQDKLFLTAGSKFEHNDFSGFEYEPSVRLSWLPTDKQTVWAAVSRAVHTPDQSNDGLNLVLQSVPGAVAGTSPFTDVVGQRPDPDSDSENLRAYEIGYRIMPNESLSLDITGYYNYYTDLVSLTEGASTLQYNPILGTYVSTPYMLGSLNSGETHGVEFTSTWEAAKFLKFSGSYTIYISHLDIQGASLVTQQGTAPNQEFNLRSYVDLSHNMQWDTMFYHVDALPALDIPAYDRLDMRLGYSPIKGFDISLIGQNLLQSEHEEYTGFLYEPVEEVSRAALIKATYRF